MELRYLQPQSNLAQQDRREEADAVTSQGTCTAQPLPTPAVAEAAEREGSSPITGVL